MKTHFTSSLAATVILCAGLAPAGFAEEQHGQEATQHLEKAEESGKAGAAGEAGKHAEEAKKHVIQQNKARPYRKSPKKISGENPKQEHDDQAFGAMDKAKGHAEKGHSEQAGEAAGQAKEHLEQKEQAK
jgi:hypothetical protein